MDNHIASVSKSLHHHIRALRHIRSSITQDVAATVATAIVGLRRDDYDNYGITQKNTSKLQKAQNLLVRVMFSTHAPSSAAALASY